MSSSGKYSSACSRFPQCIIFPAAMSIRQPIIFPDLNIENPVRASAASVDDGPLSVFPHPHGYRLHDLTAVRLPVSGLDIHMKAGKAVRTMVPVAASRAGRYYRPAAYFTCETVCAWMSFIISFFVFSSLVLPIHCFSSPYIVISLLRGPIFLQM